MARLVRSGMKAVLLAQLLDLRGELGHPVHRAQLLERQRQQQRADEQRERDDRETPAQPDVVVEEPEDRVEDVDQRLKDVGEGRLHWLGSCGASRGRAQRRLVPVVAGEGLRAGAEPSERWEGRSRGTRSPKWFASGCAQRPRCTCARCCTNAGRVCWFTPPARLAGGVCDNTGAGRGRREGANHGPRLRG